MRMTNRPTVDKKTFRDFTLIYFVSQPIPYAAAQMPHNLPSQNADFLPMSHPALDSRWPVGMFLQPAPSGLNPTWTTTAMSTSSTVISSWDR